MAEAFRLMTDPIHEAWAERAAIMEHDGGASRAAAEFRAAKWVQREFGTVPDSVRAEMERTREAGRAKQGSLLDGG